MDGMVNKVREPIFRQIISGIEEKIPPEMKRDYQAIVVAGMNVLFGDKTHKLMLERLEEGRKSGDMPGAMVKGVSQLIRLIWSQAKQPPERAAAFPASATLLAQIMDFAEQQEPGTQFTNDVVAEAMHKLMVSMADTFGVTKEQLAQEIDQIQGQGAPPAEQAPVEPAPPTEAPSAEPIPPTDQEQYVEE